MAAEEAVLEEEVNTHTSIATVSFSPDPEAEIYGEVREIGCFLSFRSVLEIYCATPTLAMICSAVYSLCVCVCVCVCAHVHVCVM